MRGNVGIGSLCTSPPTAFVEMRNLSAKKTPFEGSIKPGEVGPGRASGISICTTSCASRATGTVSTNSNVIPDHEAVAGTSDGEIKRAGMGPDNPGACRLPIPENPGSSRVMVSPGRMSMLGFTEAVTDVGALPASPPKLSSVSR